MVGRREKASKGVGNDLFVVSENGRKRTKIVAWRK